MNRPNLLGLARENIEIGLKLTSVARRLPESLNDYQISAVVALCSILELLSGLFFELVSKESKAGDLSSGLPENTRELDGLLLEIKAFLSRCKTSVTRAADSKNVELPCAAMAMEAQSLFFRLRDNYAESESDEN